MDYKMFFLSSHSYSYSFLFVVATSRINNQHIQGYEIEVIKCEMINEAVHIGVIYALRVTCALHNQSIHTLDSVMCERT